MTENSSEPDAVDPAELDPIEPDPIDSQAAADELAFDVDDLPGGALSALEAVLMVADEPIPAIRLATVLALPTDRVEELLADARRRVPRRATAAARAASRCVVPVTAGGSTPRRSTPTSSGGSCSTGRPPG